MLTVIKFATFKVQLLYINHWLKSQDTIINSNFFVVLQFLPSVSHSFAVEEFYHPE